MNEVAISYCSVKRVLKCMCQRGRGGEKVGKRQDQVATEGKVNCKGDGFAQWLTIVACRFSRKYLEREAKCGREIHWVVWKVVVLHSSPVTWISALFPQAVADYY